MRYSTILFILLSIPILTSCTVLLMRSTGNHPFGRERGRNNAQISLIDSTDLGRMKVKISLTTSDHTALPANFGADYYYLRSSNLTQEAFEGKFTTINTEIPNRIIVFETINVLRWNTCELVDVAVYLTDSHGKVQFLKKDAIPVQPVNC